MLKQVRHFLEAGGNPFPLLGCVKEVIPSRLKMAAPLDFLWRGNDKHTA